RRRKAAELDQLEGDANGAGRRMRLDILERMNALIGPDRDRRGTCERRKALEVGILEWLLQEKQRGLPRRFEVTPRRLMGKAAVGVGANRQVRPQRLAPRKGGWDLAAERLNADLELEKTNALAGLGLRLGNVLVRRCIADQPHGCNLAAQRATDEINQRQARCLAGKV